MCGNIARIYDLRDTSEENVKEDLKKVEVYISQNEKMENALPRGSFYISK